MLLNSKYYISVLLILLNSVCYSGVQVDIDMTNSTAKIKSSDQVEIKDIYVKGLGTYDVVLKYDPNNIKFDISSAILTNAEVTTSANRRCVKNDSTSRYGWHNYDASIVINTEGRYIDLTISDSGQGIPPRQIIIYNGDYYMSLGWSDSDPIYVDYKITNGSGSISKEPITLRVSGFPTSVDFSEEFTFMEPFLRTNIITC